MRHYQNIIVAMDCSPVDETLIEHVSSLAQQLHSTVHLIHVIHSHTLDQERILREQAVITLNRHLTVMQAKGIAVRMLIRSGEPEDEILSEITENKYDLLALATHGHRLHERILFGSVSRSLRNSATIPILLINENR
jgi:nucleotide-binding universal stress UspA family protein